MKPNYETEESTERTDKVISLYSDVTIALENALREHHRCMHTSNENHIKNIDEFQIKNVEKALAALVELKSAIGEL